MMMDLLVVRKQEERWKMDSRFQLSSYRQMRKKRCRATSLMLSLVIILIAPAFTYLHSDVDIATSNPTLHVPMPAAAASVSNNNHIGDQDLLTVMPHEIDSLSQQPSCRHTKTHLNFQNKHKTKSMTITAIDVLPTASNSTTLLYISKFGDRHAIIPPQSGLLLPVTFVPSFQSLAKKKMKASQEKRKFNQGLSKAAIADFHDLIGLGSEDIFYGDDEDFLQTFYIPLVVHTSFGLFHKIVNASAVVLNPFHLPHTISFYSDGYVSGSSQGFMLEQDRTNFISEKEYWADNKSLYQFDLYMDNPWTDDEILLKEIYLSRPDLVSLAFQHNGKRRFNNCRNKDHADTCSQPHGHDITGPPVMPPGAEKVYISTMYVNATLLDMKMHDEVSMPLGYLRIVTPNATLTIDIEYIDGRIDSIGTNSDSSLQVNQLQVVEINDSSANPTVADKEETPINFGSSKSHISSSSNMHLNRIQCDPFKRKSNLMLRTYPIASTDIKSHQSKSGVSSNTFSSSPSFLDFGILTSVNQTRKIDISISNNGKNPVRLMRFKIGIDALPAGRSQGSDSHDAIFLTAHDDYNQHHALHAFLDIGDTKNPQVIEPGATVTNFASLILQSKINLSENNSNNIMPLRYMGSVLLHFGRSDKQFSDWKNEILSDPLGFQENLLEIKFEVNILYGDIQYFVDEVYFPTKVSHFRTEIENASRLNDAKCSSGFHRTLHVKNSFSEEIRIVGLTIQNDTNNNAQNSTVYDCRKSFSLYDFEGSDHNTKYSSRSVAQPGQFWGGITLNYEYFPTSMDRNVVMFESLKCSLVIETDLAGHFHIPLNLFSGSFTVQADNSDVMSIRAHNGHNALVKFGMDDCFEYAKDSIVGSLISSSLISSYLSNKPKQEVSNHKWKKILFRHFSTLAGSIYGSAEQYSSVDPVIISLGSMSANSTDSYPIFIKNLNPIPLQISALISAIEGMEIRLGRAVTNMKDFVNAALSDVKDEQQRSNEWLKPHLSQRGTILDSFLYRDEISLSSEASITLQKLFQTTAEIHFHRNKVDGVTFSLNKNDPSAHLNMHPPGFSQTLCSTNKIQKDLSPTLQMNGRACNLDYRRFEKKPQSWIIPPGGVAKFELLVRSPPKQVFRDDEYSDILSSGLLLQSNFGQLLPIIVSYHTLSGRLQIQQKIDQNATSHAEAYPVYRTSLGPPFPKRLHKESSFMIENTLSSDILLRKIYSCNKWFQVELQQNVSAIEKSENLLVRKGDFVRATVHSIIDCPHSTITNAQMQSFFNCALDWLENRHLLVSDDCSEQGYIEDNFAVKHSSKSTDTQKSIARAIEVFKEVVMYNAIVARKHDIAPQTLSNTAAAEQGTKETNMLSQEAEKMYQRAFAEWKSICKLGLNVVIGNARAEFELVGDDTNQSKIPRKIWNTLDKSYLRTEISIPRLFAGGNLLNFGLVTVSKPSAMFIPIINPTGHPIRVRLITSSQNRVNHFSNESKIFLQNNHKSKHSWWTGGSYYLSDEKGALLISNHNVTIETSSGSSLSLMNPSLHSSSAFTHGCSGRRCGAAFPSNSNNRLIESVSPIGASASTSSTLIGRVYSKYGTVDNKVPSPISPANIYPPFALGSNSLKEVIVPAYGSANLGPIFFRPPTRNRFRSKLYLENSWTGIEKVRVEGIGGWEKIVFLEGNELGSNIEIRFNKQILMFTKTKADTKRSIFRQVFIANLGDTEVQVDGLHLREANSIQNNHHGQSYLDETSNRCKRRGFEILECPDIIQQQNRTAKPNDLHRFILKPKEARNVRVMYTHDCSFKSMYVKLVLDYTNSAGLSKEYRQVELLLGFDLDPAGVDFCMASHNRGIAIEFKRAYGASGTEGKIVSTLFWLKLLSCIVPLLVLTLIMIEIIYIVFRKRVSSKSFIDATLKKIENTETRNWSHAYSFMPRVDLDSADLTNFGKEQVRQSFLTRFREEGMLPPQCVLQNGTLSRQKYALVGNHREETGKNIQLSTVQTPISRRASATGTKTLSEIIFMHYHGNNSVPHGFDWKKALSKGMIRLKRKKFSTQQVSCRKDKDAVDTSEKITKKSISEQVVGISDQPRVTREAKLYTKATTSVNLDEGVKKANKESDKDFSEDNVCAPSKKMEEVKSIEIICATIVENNQAKIPPMSEKLHVPVSQKSEIPETNTVTKVEKEASQRQESKAFEKIRSPAEKKEGNDINLPNSSEEKLISSKQKNSHDADVGTRSCILSVVVDDDKSMEFQKPSFEEVGVESMEDPLTEGLNFKKTKSLLIDSSFDFVSGIEDLDCESDSQAIVSEYSPIGSRREEPDDSNGIVNTQEGNVSADSIQNEDDISTFRPPPGLAPPPGFATTDMLQLPVPEERMPPARLMTSIPDVSDLPSSRDHGLLSNLLINQNELQSPLNPVNEDSRYNNFDNERCAILQGLDQESQGFRQHDGEKDSNLLVWGQEDICVQSDDGVDALHLELGQDFNVMNFLSFLDEGPQDKGGQDEGMQIDTMYSEKDSNGDNDLYTSSMYGTNHSTVQANPWGGSGTSRALAYGIEVELEKDCLSANDDLELLTPSMILGQDVFPTENEDSDNDILNLGHYLEEKQ